MNPAVDWLLRIAYRLFATDGAPRFAPCGQRWGPGRAALTPDFLAASQAGKNMALEVGGEGVAFWLLDCLAGCADWAESGGLGYEV